MMALRWIGAAMLEAAKGFRRLNNYQPWGGSLGPSGHPLHQPRPCAVGQGCVTCPTSNACWTNFNSGRKIPRTIIRLTLNGSMFNAKPGSIFDATKHPLPFAAP